MLKLIFIGLIAGLFFSSTFVLNRLMSIEGGHWVWSAALRYFYMILLLVAWQTLHQGLAATKQALRLFAQNYFFWILAGSIGFGGFYALVCYGADHAPGWVIATTWQLTIIASLVVLICFGRTFPKRIWVFSTIVLAGVLLVNLSQVEFVHIKQMGAAVLPVLIATFCYPTGNQLVWEARHGNPYLPQITDPLLDNPFNKVLLMSLGSLPFWAILIAFFRPGIPSSGQLMHTALVALFSGVCATTLFLSARTKARRASEIAAVDATQSSEVVFALAGEVIILNAPLPNGAAALGIVLVFLGLTLFIGFQEEVE